MIDKGTHQLLLSLIRCLRNVYTDRECMLALCHEASKKTAVLRGWEDEYIGMALNPPAPIHQKIVDVLQPLEDLVIQGLDEKSFQELLTRAQGLDQKMQSIDRGR